MRIMHVINSLGCGGAEKLVIDLAAEMTANGHDVMIVSLTDIIGFPVEIKNKRINVRTCGFVGTIYNIPIMLRTRTELARLCRMYRPDVMHSHMFLADILARHVCPSTCAMVTTFHSNECWWEPTTLKTSLKTRFEGGSARSKPGLFVAVSELARTKAIMALKIDPKRIEVINNGVDVLRFSSVERTATTPVAILHVARFYPEKRHDIMLDAFARVVAEHPQVELWLVGDGPLRSAIENDVQARRFAGNVRFLGRRQDIPELLAKASVFALSSDREGLPISLLESMAARVPIVATDVGDVANAIVHEVTGLLCSSGNGRNLAENMIRIISDDHLATALANNAFRRVNENYSIHATSAAYVDVYMRAKSLS